MPFNIEYGAIPLVDPRYNRFSNTSLSFNDAFLILLNDDFNASSESGFPFFKVDE